MCSFLISMDQTKHCVAKDLSKISWGESGKDKVGHLVRDKEHDEVDANFNNLYVNEGPLLLP